MVLHLGVGMSSFVIGLASLRLAPVQAASFGHTATTRSPEIDAMILPDDFVGDPALFSEPLVRLPAAAMPYRLRRDLDFAEIGRRARAARADGAPVAHRRARLGDEAGPAAVRRPGRGPPRGAGRRWRSTSSRSAAPASGYEELNRRAGASACRWPCVHEELPYEAYIDRLAACDFFVCPFPYGNMNSIVDAVMVGLPGVCLDGPEAHAHADVAYFRRLGLPDALRRTCDYVAAIVAGGRSAGWRCQAAARTVDRGHPFFGGTRAVRQGDPAAVGR